MSEFAAMITIACAGMLAITIAAVAALRGWEDWLELRRIELDQGRPSPPRGSGRVELSELRARVRRLEAIANGSED
jgi:hypothetical protein